MFYIVVQCTVLALLIALNADLLFKRTQKQEEPQFNGPLLLVMIALSTATTFFLYYKAAWADPGFVKTQVFMH